MKKTLLVLLCVVFCLTLFTACAHQHEWSSEWQSDGTHHWRACSGEGCTEIGEKVAHSGGTATCTAKAVCAECGASYGEASAHSFVEEVADAEYLRTPATCIAKPTYFKSCSCGAKGSEYFTATGVAYAEHQKATAISYDDTHHYYECVADENCSEQMDKALHTLETKYSTDFSKTWQECSGCEYKTAESVHAHTSDTLLFRESFTQEYKVCSVCQQEFDVATHVHAGGEASCSAPATCSACNQPYGTADATMHHLVYVQENDQHHQECDNDGCTYQTAPVDCSGGTATCQAKAICEICKNAYGSVDANAHNPESAWTPDGQGNHYHVCQNGECDVQVGLTPCAGGTATCQAKAICAACENAYGELGAHAMQSGENYSYNATQHWYKCTTEGCTHTEGVENHHDGTATCTEQAICQDCKQYYGELEQHAYEQDSADQKALKSPATCTSSAIYFESCSACGALSQTTFTVGNALDHEYAEAPAWSSEGNVYTASYPCTLENDACTAAETKAITVYIENGSITHVEDNSAFKFKVTPSEHYHLVSVKLGQDTLTADGQGIYSVAIATAQIDIEIAIDQHTITWKTAVGQYWSSAENATITAYEDNTKVYDYGTVTDGKEYWGSLAYGYNVNSHTAWADDAGSRKTNITVTGDATYTEKVGLDMSWVLTDALTLPTADSPATYNASYTWATDGASKKNSLGNAAAHTITEESYRHIGASSSGTWTGGIVADINAATYYRMGFQFGFNNMYDISELTNLTFQFATKDSALRNVYIRDNKGNALLQVNEEKYAYTFVICNIQQGESSATADVYIDETFVRTIDVTNGLELFIDRSECASKSWYPFELTFPKVNVEFTSESLAVVETSLLPGGSSRYTETVLTEDLPALPNVTKLYQVKITGYCNPALVDVTIPENCSELYFYIRREGNLVVNGTLTVFNASYDIYEYNIVRLKKGNDGWSVTVNGVAVSGVIAQEGTTLKMSAMKLDENGANATADAPEYLYYTNFVVVK